MYPTLASLIEERLLDDPALTQVAIRAFNDAMAADVRVRVVVLTVGDGVTLAQKL